MPERTVKEVADLVRRKREKNGVRCALLIGAGCSFQAGIPLASGFVEQIRERFPDEYTRAEEKTYPLCMAQLDRADRHTLISEYVDKAKINWAHISIAQMMRAGFVDRVLTTNFDPLVVRACALLNLYPAVYDMAVVRKGFVRDYVRDLAVFHLHGQRDGFVQLHEKAQVDDLREAIKPLFDDTANQRIWIVVGYSGQQDPVFQVLADRPEFPNRLFWVGYRDEPPTEDVRAALIEPRNGAEWISGYDPDNFLLQLASRLGCFPPEFFSRPFSHLLECFATLAGFRPPGQDEELDWAARARTWIEQAKATFEPAEPSGSPPAPPPGPPPSAAKPVTPAPPPVAAEIFRTSSLGAAAGFGRPAGLDEAVAAAVRTAVRLSSVPPEDVVGAAWAAMMAGDYDAVIALAPEYESGREPQLAEPLIHALVGAARELQAEASSPGAHGRMELLRRAAEYTRQAELISLKQGAAALRDT